MISRKFLRIAVLFLALGLTLTATYAVIATSTNSNASRKVNRSSDFTVVAYGYSARLGIYSDSACTVPLRNINWGSTATGENVSKTIYLKNTGSASLSIGMATNNWNPTTANGPLTIVWNKQGTVLLPRQSTAATLTLKVLPNAAEMATFNVQIIISGSTNPRV
jgi:hypothetical protein